MQIKLIVVVVAIRKLLCLPIFGNVTKIVKKKLRVYMILGDAVTKLQTFVLFLTMFQES